MKTWILLFLVGLVAPEVPTPHTSLDFTADDLYLEGRTSGNLPLDDEDGEDDGSGSGSGDYAFTEWMNKEEKFLKLTTVSSEIVPGLDQAATSSPNEAPTTTAHSQHLTTTAKDTFPESDKKNEEVVAVDPTTDWFSQRTSPSSPPPVDTTRFSRDVIVTKDTDGDNSLDRWDRPTPKYNEDQYDIIENEIVPSNGRGSRIYDKRPEEVISENLWERTEVLAAVIACGVVGFLCAVFLLLLLAYRMKKKDEGSYELGDTKLSNAQYHKAPTKEFYA